MKLQILLPIDEPKEGVINLKSFIDRAEIEGINKVEIENVSLGHGEMGAGDILNSIKTVIEAATEPLVELVKCLQKYVDNYRTVVVIEAPDGKKIELKHGRSMKPEELKILVTSILNNNQS